MISIGNPSNSVISGIDRRINGKILVETTSACYSVCEAKGATMPSEKTPQNLSSCISSIAGGYSSGNINVPVTGNITGIDDQGRSVTGCICGSVDGDVCGSVIGSVGGDVGNSVYGSVMGSVMGSVFNVGFVIDNVGGDVCGSVCGTVYGDVCGGVHGSVCGDVGNSVYGSIVGSVCGDILGNVDGDVHGGVCGTLFLPNASGSNVTIDKTSTNSALHINVSDTDYYVHVS